MAHPLDPQSRSAAARLLDVPEATLCSLESRRTVEPVSEWGPTDEARPSVARMTKAAHSNTAPTPPAMTTAHQFTGTSQRANQTGGSPSPNYSPNYSPSF